MVSSAGVEKVSSSKLESDDVGEEMRNEGSADGPARRLSLEDVAGMVEVLRCYTMAFVPASTYVRLS